MAARYQVRCPCGAATYVQLTDAGIAKQCDSCRQVFDVPSATTLKEEAAVDPRPNLSPLEKIVLAWQAKEPPFDGVCQCCEDAKATYVTFVGLAWPLSLSTTARGSVHFSKPGEKSLAIRTDKYESIALPLMLCNQCQAKFARVRAKNSFGWGALIACVASGLAAALLIGVRGTIDALSFVLGLTFVGSGTMMLSLYQRGDRWVVPWICLIRWVPELFELGCAVVVPVRRSIPIRER